jgi:hypothetical protein
VPIEERLHNHTAAELGKLAFEAQERLKFAQEDFATCKLNLIGIAKGAKMEIAVPEFGRVLVVPPKLDGKRKYTVDSEKFDQLDITLRQQLFLGSVIVEAKQPEEPPLPAVRILPL